MEPIHRQHLAGWQPPDREVASFNAGRQLRICVMRGGATAGRGPPARAATGPLPPSPLLLLLLLLLPVVHPDPASFANSIIINQHIGPHMPHYAFVHINSKESQFPVHRFEHMIFFLCVRLSFSSFGDSLAWTEYLLTVEHQKRCFLSRKVGLPVLTAEQYDLILQ